MSTEKQSADSFLITGAETSLDEQHRKRVRKYLFMMSFRIPALLIAGFVYMETQNAWWAVGIIALSIPIPWMAVLIANDRPPRKKGEVQYYRYGAGRTVGPPELTVEPEPAPPADPKVIEGSVDESTVDPSTVDDEASADPDRP